MLEGLDSVDWTGLHHAYGVASDIPDLLIELEETKDINSWLRVIEDFSNKIFHQATIYSATSATIPFLNQLVRQADSERMHYLLALIGYMLQESYLSGRWWHNRLPPTAFKSELAVYEVIAEAKDLYLGLLSHSDVRVRLLAVVICSNLRTVSEIFDRLVERISLEIDPLLRGQILSELGGRWYFERTFEEQLKLRDYVLVIAQDVAQAPIVHLAARIVLADMHSPKYPIPQQLLDFLIQGYIHPIAFSPNAKRYGHAVSVAELFPFEKHHILDALVKLASIRLFDSGLFTLFEHPELEAVDAHLVGRELVDYAFRRYDAGYETGYPFRTRWFNEQFPRQAYAVSYTYQNHRGVGRTHYWPRQKLTDRQEKVLSTIVNSDRFWSIPTNLFSFFYGLPDSRDELRALIENASS
jgi:hypothetical protein